MNVSDKVTAATTAGTAASALVTLGLWALQQYAGVELPAPVQAAVLVLVTAACTGIAAFVAGWSKTENSPAPSAVATVKRQHLA